MRLLRLKGVLLALIGFGVAGTPLWSDAKPVDHPSMDHPKIQADYLRWGSAALVPGLRSVLSGKNGIARARSARSPQFSQRLVIRGKLDKTVLHQIRALGADLEFVSERYGSATVRLSDIDDAAAIARLGGVSSVALPEPRITRVGSAESRAPRALRVEGAELGRGDGRRIGLISDSFARGADVRDTNTTPASGAAGLLQGSRPQDSGDLPGQVQILREGAEDATDEGAALAELAFDLAPGLGVLFHTAGQSRAEFASAVENLCGSGVDVVVDDIGFLLEPYYQDGWVARAAVDHCIAAGIPYVSAAGNEGDSAYRQIFVDINPSLDDKPGAATDFAATGADLHNWGDGDGFLAVTVPAGERVYAVLQWNQPNASLNAALGAQVDLDLYASSDDSLAALNPAHPDHIARSHSAQGDTGQPLGDAAEFVELRAAADNDTTFYLAVEHYQGSQGAIPQSASTPLEFRLVFIGPVLTAEYPFNGPSMWGHTVAEGVISTAAVPWWESPEFAPSSFSSAAIDPEPFTSRGGNLHIQFDRQGRFNAVTRFAPTLAGVDGNNTSFFGGDFRRGASPGFGEPDGDPNFFGTSAAAPNVAAVIALVREAFPGLSVRDITDGLTATAIDVRGERADVGTDAVTGAGLLDAQAALAYFRANFSSEPDDDAPAGDDSSEGTQAAPALADSGGGGGGCFIATAAYGSYWTKEVRTLREFRDRVLRRSSAGRWFIEQYYRYSPALADRIRDSEGARTSVRVLLTPLVWTIQSPHLAAASLCLFLVGLPALYRRRHTVDVI